MNKKKTLMDYHVVVLAVRCSVILFAVSFWSLIFTSCSDMSPFKFVYKDNNGNTIVVDNPSKKEEVPPCNIKNDK